MTKFSFKRTRDAAGYTWDIRAYRCVPEMAYGGITVRHTIWISDTAPDFMRNQYARILRQLRLAIHKDQVTLGALKVFKPHAQTPHKI